MEGSWGEIGLRVVWKVDFCTFFTGKLTRFDTGALRFERFLQFFCRRFTRCFLFYANFASAT